MLFRSTRDYRMGTTCLKRVARADYDASRAPPETPKAAAIRSDLTPTSMTEKDDGAPEPSQDTASLVKRLAGPSITKAG